MSEVFVNKPISDRTGHPDLTRQEAQAKQFPRSIVTLTNVHAKADRQPGTAATA